MSVPAAVVLGIGIGAAIFGSPLLGIGAVWVADQLADWNFRHEGLTEWARARGWDD